MTPIEIFVLVFMILALVKLITIAFSPKSWKGIVDGIYKSPVLLAIVELVLAAILFYYLLQDLTLIQIMGGVVLGALLTGMTFAIFAKEIIPAMTKLLRPGMLKRAWLPVIIWLVLVIWTLVTLF